MVQIMKIEIGTKKPDTFKEYWEGQYEVFSPYEFACGIPQILIAITTFKENGNPNINFHAWNCFQGDGEGFFAILAGISCNSHTLANIERTGEFCVNFLSKQYYDGLMSTIQGNEEEDEFVVGGFTTESASLIAAPRIKESFLTLECKKENIFSLSGTGMSNLVIGRVVNVAAEEDYMKGIDKKYSEDGFMLNVHSPINIFTGEGNVSGIATLKVERIL